MAVKTKVDTGIPKARKAARHSHTRAIKTRSPQVGGRRARSEGEGEGEGMASEAEGEGEDNDSAMACARLAYAYSVYRSKSDAREAQS